MLRVESLLASVLQPASDMKRDQRQSISRCPQAFLRNGAGESLATRTSLVAATRVTRSQPPTFCRLKERHHSSTREHRTLDIKGSLFCLPPEPRTKCSNLMSNLFCFA